MLTRNIVIHVHFSAHPATQTNLHKLYKLTFSLTTILLGIGQTHGKYTLNHLFITLLLPLLSTHKTPKDSL